MTFVCKLLWYPKFYSHVILLVVTKTLGNLLNFDWFGPNFWKHIVYSTVNLYIIIEIAHQLNVRFAGLTNFNDRL